MAVESWYVQVYVSVCVVGREDKKELGGGYVQCRVCFDLEVLCGVVW